MIIEKNKVVLINYSVKSTTGELIDSSTNDDPLGFIFGTGSLIKGLEKELDGKKVGDAFQATIPPNEAYGDKNPNAIQTLPLTQFQEKDKVEVGAMFQMVNNQGQQLMARVTGVDGENVTVDMNHPLAGETLNFDITILEVRDATAEELDHGHVHGKGGVQH